MAKAKIVTDISNKYFTNNKINIGTAVPTTGTYKAGDVVYSSSPNSTAFGWICTAAGTPGTWKVLQSGADASAAWGNISGKPSTFAPTIGTTSTTAFRGDYGNTAYNHSQAAHAPSNAQKNSDITKAEIEAKLTGDMISAHKHHVLTCVDNRDDNTPPKDFTVGFETNFKKRGTIGYPHGSGMYTTVTTLKPWDDKSGGNAVQLSYGSEDDLPVLSARVGVVDGDSWGQWKRLFSESDRILNVTKPPTGDYGFGSNERPCGMVGSFPGWNNDCLYINTYSANNGIESYSFSNVKVKGTNVHLEGNVSVANQFTVGSNARIPEIQNEVRFREDPTIGWVDPWTNVGAAIKAHGNIAATGTIKGGAIDGGAFTLTNVFGDCGLKGGNGDAANYETHNMVIKSWWGIGFRDYQNICRTYLDTRSGDFYTKGSFVTDQPIFMQGKRLFIQWGDPGWGEEGSIWIRS